MSLLGMMQWHKVLWKNMIKKLSYPCSYMCTSTWIIWVHLLTLKIIFNGHAISSTWKKQVVVIFVGWVWTLKNMKIFMCWVAHETKSPTIYFLAHQVLARDCGVSNWNQKNFQHCKCNHKSSLIQAWKWTLTISFSNNCQ